MFKILEEDTGRVLFEHEDGTACIEWLKRFAGEDNQKWETHWLSMDKSASISLIEKHALWAYLEKKARSKHGFGADYVLSKTNVTSALAQRKNLIQYELINFQTYREVKGSIPLYMELAKVG